MRLSGDSVRTLLRAEAQASGNRAARNERHPQRAGSIPVRHATVVARPAVMLRKPNAAVTAFRTVLLVLLPAGWRVQDVPG
jgi:hypothetical protein